MKEEILEQFAVAVELAVELEQFLTGNDETAEFQGDIAQLVGLTESMLAFTKEEFAKCHDDGSPEKFAKEAQHARHEIGNQLNQVLGYCQLLELDAEDSDPRLLDVLRKLKRYCESAAAQLSYFGKEISDVPETDPASVLDLSLPTSDRKDNAPPSDPADILIVDDNAANLDLLAQFLSRENHRVATAADGPSALKLMRSQNFDVVLLDVLLPGMDGLEIFTRMKQDDRLRGTSVIMVSGLDDQERVKHAIELGAEDWLSKPIDFVLLKARIKGCRERRRAQEMQLRQQFSEQLADVLLFRPELLTARKATVTLLFCDIRRFSAISERLGSEETIRWISESMEELSECIDDHHGVLVDIIGDEIVAMWGAPEPTDDHADLACHAAFSMLERVEQLDKVWRKELGEPMRVGIGLNSGDVHVGNIGSRRKKKYGPLGSEVNLASRIQGTTKFLKSDIVISGRTRAFLQSPESFAMRRLCQARLVNIGEAIQLFELRNDRQQFEEMFRKYESALQMFEDRSFNEAAAMLGSLMADYRHDGPSQLLMQRVLGALVTDGAEFNEIWEPPGK